MPNCFVFAIGGTGSRVLRSLAHLFAAGVKPENDDWNVVPIIIDPHSSNNQELERTEKLLGNYRKVREVSNARGFFAVDIKTLKDVKNSREINPSFSFKLEGANTTFKDYIGYSSMSAGSKALANLLFSGSSKNRAGKECDLLDIEMDIGFVGNPNVGSVVLNQLKNSKPYEAFANAISTTGEDRIFIISSIFGGTGAAGFPCLLKNIRDGQDAGCGSGDILKKTPIGAVTVLPYFKLQNDESSPISYADFIAKTKSALNYYADNVTGNHSVNMMYYIGDNPDGLYENDPGRGGQKNKSHFVELASAMAIVDFLDEKSGSSYLECELAGADSYGQAVAPICKQLGIRNFDARVLKFSDFHEKHQKLLASHLTQFALFRKYMVEPAAFDKRAGSKSWSKEKDMPIDAKIKTDTFYTNFLGEILVDFAEWIKELAENQRGFDPLNMESSDLNLLIKDAPIKPKFLSKGFTYDDYDDYLAKYSRGSFKSREEMLVSIFYDATKDIFKEKYNQ
jgi:hypothetical protein